LPRARTADPRKSTPAIRSYTDQIVYVVEGEAIVRIGDKEHRASAGSLVMIPARTRHHVQNPGREPLFFVTVYAPPAY
jgi:mannose-6-phosphate isomerase-like protein (cupin superfamily)